jgi:hypothetical protein
MNKLNLHDEAIQLARHAASAPFESDPVMRSMVDEILALSPLERIRMLEDTVAGFQAVK